MIESIGCYPTAMQGRSTRLSRHPDVPHSGDLLPSTWKGNASFAFAGIWEHWERDGKTLDSCSIIVTEANTLMKPIHDRMPVILPPKLYDAWMDPSVSEPETLLPLLTPYPAERMTLHKVKTTVNSPRNEGPALIEPVTG